jgi:DNA-binding transcriptional MocR family regulator
LSASQWTEGGLDPDALKAACKRHRPKAVYLIPTLHNPTTITLGPERRKAVADIIRHTGTILIEDDAYGLLEPSASPIANLIPELSYLAVSLSKSIAPALRVSYLLVPDAASDQVMRNNLQATMQMPPPLMVALATNWLRSGIADQIITAIRNEATGRQQLAAPILKELPFVGKPGAHHLWLSWAARRSPSMGRHHTPFASPSGPPGTALNCPRRCTFSPRLLSPPLGRSRSFR